MPNVRQSEIELCTRIILIQFGKNVLQFLKDVANDERIPPQDKTVLLALIALVISPFDIIPDWIPVLGQLDDLVIIALILDYFFNKLDSEILLTHYPWGMKSFAALRRYARFVAIVTPSVLKNRIWSYQGSVYK